jgi:para-aminobenzoate synthetase component 1
MLHVEPIPYVDPVAAFAPLAGEPFAALLDSADEAGGRGVTSYVAASPWRTIVAAERTLVDGEPSPVDPLTALERELAAVRAPPGLAPVPFATGAIGFFGYELGRHLLTTPAPRPCERGVPDLAVGLYDVVAAFDHAARRAWILASGLPERDPSARLDRARARAAWLRDRLGRAAPAVAPFHADGRWEAELSPDEHAARVRRALDHIRAGDVYQVNLTQRFRAPLPAGLDAFELYLRLRRETPAPFAAFLRAPGGVAVASASPERFVALDAAGRVEARPIKGTRPRGASPGEDRARAAELASSPKDRAENVMIVDLLRNDLGRVCRPGSVRVPTLVGLETFARVHHLVSAVEGTLRPGLGPIDLLRAAFPGGSITGAPKERAMAILRELEPSRRGPYCGSIAWIGLDGAMDASIVIRTLVVARGEVVAQAGGGVVADSEPRAEHEELLVKARPLLATLGALA